MSLINDMLRDLDARRRGVPSHGVDADSLKPAGEIPARKSVTSRLLLGMGIAVLLAGALLLAALWYSAEEPSTTLAENVPVPTASDDDNASASSSSSERMEELARRMRELEEENRRLAQRSGDGDDDGGRRVSSEESGASGSSANASTSGNGGSDPASPLQQAGTSEERNASSYEPRDWSGDSTASPSQSARSGQSRMADAQSPSSSAGSDTETSVPGTPSTGTSTGQDEDSVRQPREMSFRERDRQNVQQALSTWRDGQQSDALRALDEFITEHPEAHQSREILAKLLLQRGETRTARTITEMGLTIAPGHAGYRKIMARLMIADDEAEEALELLETRQPSVESDPEFHELLASAALSASDWEKARLAYQRLLQHDESSGRWWYGLAASLDAMGRDDDAAHAYDRALRGDGLSATMRRTSQQRLNGLSE